MASSQVETALTSPFGCVLRKYNHHRERCRESTSRVSSSQGTTLHQNDNDRSSFVVGDHHVAARIDVVKNMNNSNVNNDAKNSNVGLTKKKKEDESLSSSNENNNNDPNRQSQILDRWAARKAKEMVSTIETEAELLENLGNSSSTSSLSSLSETTLNNPGASSLVQIWEKRLNNLNHQSLKCNTTSSRTSSLGSSDAGELMDESSSSSLYSDWVGATSTDTNEAASSCSTPKVADIIKRLKENKYGQDQQSNNNSNSNNNNNNNMMMMGSSCLSSSRDQQGQHTSVVLHHVASSPRFRGRRALTDLLMQRERDRHGELNNLAQLAPVSNFSQRGRGRIQSLLRLRLLKRHHESTTYEKKRQPKGSTIMHLRERFNVEVKQGSTTQPEIDNSRNTHLNQPESPIPVHNPIGEHSNPIGSDPEVNMTNGCQNDNDDDAYDHTEACAHKPEEEASASSETVCLEAQNNIASHEVGETRTCYMVESDANHETKEEAELAEVKQDNSAETEINYVDNGTIANIEVQDEHASDEGKDYDDADDDDQHYDDDDEHYYDWISPIARPRSYWEDRRQAWYKEMLDTASSDKREIRQLLERRTVSTFLSSDFRERMDKLMEYHIGSQTHFISSQEDDEDNGGRMGQLVSFSEQHIQRRGHNLEEAETREEEQKEEEEEEEERLSNNNGGYNETSDDGNQSSSSSSTNNLISSSPNMSSWSYRDNEAASDDSEDRVDESATSSSTQPSQSPTRQCINPHSMEMDLIYDMRGQMEQLYREMAEIRKSLKTCIDMQMMLQKSMKRDVNTALREKKKKRKSNDQKPPKKGNCCICYEKKVDSLLYRCGHMCTCMNCANELQWNSGKCPICRATIADVVRVYVDA